MRDASLNNRDSSLLTVSKNVLFLGLQAERLAARLSQASFVRLSTGQAKLWRGSVKRNLVLAALVGRGQLSLPAWQV